MNLRDEEGCGQMKAGDEERLWAWRTVVYAKGTIVAGNHLSGTQDVGHQGDICVDGKS